MLIRWNRSIAFVDGLFAALPELEEEPVGEGTSAELLSSVFIVPVKTMTAHLVLLY